MWASCRDSRYPVNDREHDPVPEKVAVAAKENKGSRRVMHEALAVVLHPMTVAARYPAGTIKPAPTGGVFLFVFRFFRIYELLIRPNRILS